MNPFKYDDNIRANNKQVISYLKVHMMDYEGDINDLTKYFSVLSCITVAGKVTLIFA